MKPGHFLFCRVLFVRLSFALLFRLPLALFILSPLSVILYALRSEPCAHVAQSSQFPAILGPVTLALCISTAILLVTRSRHCFHALLHT